MIRFLSIVFLLIIIIGNFISPINSFAPNHVEGGSKETSVYSYSEVEDPLTKKDINQIREYQESTNDPTESIDSMSIWREWFGNRDDHDTEYTK